MARQKSLLEEMLKFPQQKVGVVDWYKSVAPVRRNPVTGYGCTMMFVDDPLKDTPVSKTVLEEVTKRIKEETDRAFRYGVRITGA